MASPDSAAVALPSSVGPSPSVTVRELIDRLAPARGPLELGIQIALAAGELLREAHERVGGAVIHGGLEPSRVLLQEDGTVQLAGFGESYSARRRLAYQAPELRRGERPDVLADVYALGALLYELCTGYNLLQALTRASCGGNEPAPRPSRFHPGIDDALDELILQALAKDPIDRPYSVRTLLEPLRSIFEDLGGSPEPERLANFLDASFPWLSPRASGVLPALNLVPAPQIDRRAPEAGAAGASSAGDVSAEAGPVAAAASLASAAPLSAGAGPVAAAASGAGGPLSAAAGSVVGRMSVPGATPKPASLAGASRLGDPSVGAKPPAVAGSARRPVRPAFMEEDEAEDDDPVASASPEWLAQLRTAWAKRPVKAGVTVAALLFAVVALSPSGRDVQVVSTPSGATVIVDGRVRGVTPMKLKSLSREDHTVELELAGHKPSTRELQLGRRATDRLEITLEKENVPATPGRWVIKPAAETQELLRRKGVKVAAKAGR